MTNNQKKMRALSSLGIASTIQGDEFIVHTEEPIPTDAELLLLYDEIIAKEAGEAERKIKEQAAKEKATQMTVAKMLLANELTDDEILDMVYLYPAWNVGIAYKVGDMVEYLGKLYEVIQAHTSQDDWRPADVPALFTSRMPAGVIPEWTQPTGAHDAYNIGDQVTFEGAVYESLIDGNTYSPTVYPQGWQLI